MKTNLHIYPNPLSNQSRILKITEWLISQNVFDRIISVGISGPGLSSLQKTGRHRFIVRFPRGGVSNTLWLLKALAFIPWYIRVLMLALRFRPVCISAHSLSVLPVSVAAKWLCRAKLVYDTHELETEVYTATGLRKALLKLVERLLIPCADQVVTVCDGIADWYEKEYRIPRPFVVRNVPNAPVQQERGAYLKSFFKIPDDHVIALYLGILAKGREVEKIIEAWREAPGFWHLVIVGYGPLLDACKQLAGKMENVHFHDPVPLSQIVPLASSADVGLSFLDPACLSHYYSLPNKLFEYLCAGVPVASNDLPEKRKIIEQDDCGWIFPSNDVRGLFKIKREDILAKAPAARRTAQRNQWAGETRELKKVYQALGFIKE